LLAAIVNLVGAGGGLASRIDEAIAVATKVIPGIQGIDLIATEAADYDAAEIAELKSIFVDAVDLPNDVAEDLGEDAFAVLIPLAKLISKFLQKSK